ncbi:hypothetical protein [Saccharothrix texasensis]|uniref:Subtilisin inhibitor-like n=1 Tax=Saccharothrix texasensis TaxID=103734 RepID=A0A3N1HGW4_9PSEU|nr:hypothetical protein [Saccharothrix texasensis]ROP41716.1 hypothetical protein EDD40_7152 [Saccharothrix texasensis]
MPGAGRGAPPVVLLVAVLALVTGCSATVTGSGAGVPTTAAGAEPTSGPTVGPTSDSTPEPTSEPDPEHDPVPVPTIDEGAPARYCDDPFPGALGKPMLAVVVETPSGRLTCDGAAAVLVDYYAQRRDPTPGLVPLVVGSMTCNQVPEPALPQVVCADGDDVVYSMWPQT